MKDPFEKLRKNRSYLLAMEAVGWLHMFWKAKEGFIKVPDWPENVENVFAPLEQLKGLFPGLRTHLPGNPREFLKRQDGKALPQLRGLLAAAHGMASGIEKQSNSHNPPSTSRLSSAFGCEGPDLLDTKPDVLSDSAEQERIQRIGALLEKLLQIAKACQGEDQVEQLRQWRDEAVGQKGWIRTGFGGLLAETRVPNQDVSLFDQSYVTASLFKSATTQGLLEKNFQWASLEISSAIQWRVLTVGIGTGHYEARSIKIGDWTGALSDTREFFREVADLVEVDLALGNRLFADDELAAFTFPGVADDVVAALEQNLRERICQLARDKEFETPPIVKVSETTRTFVPMARELASVRATLRVPLHEAWSLRSQIEGQGHVCPVCSIRRAETKGSKQQLCSICRGRRHRRLDPWLGGKAGDSIWVSEVADSTDRLALVTMRLDLEPWLTGVCLDSLRTWTCEAALAAAWGNQVPRTGSSYSSLVAYAEKCLAGTFDAQDPVFGHLQNGFKTFRCFEKFFNSIVADRAEAPVWGALDDKGRARWLIHQLFRKLASPGRVYRLQRQAECFFQERLEAIRTLMPSERRYIVTAKEVHSSWKDRQVYNSRIGDSPISLLYRKDRQSFLTICNMSRLGSRPDALRGQELKLKSDDEDTASTLVVQGVEEETAGLGRYQAIIPLSLSPLRFRVVVPLEFAEKVVEEAREAWRAQMSRVFDRLPLKVGIVAFPRLSPYQAVIEAARFLEEGLESATLETWKVANNTEGGFLRIKAPSGREDCWPWPSALRTRQKGSPKEGTTADEFYPYFDIGAVAAKKELDFELPDGSATYRHRKDLVEGDQVRIYPARIATVFLDGTARRFDPIEVRYLSEWQEMLDLWHKVVVKVPSLNRLRSIWAELSARREQWQDPDGGWLAGGEKEWLDLARTFFRANFPKIAEQERELLVQEARSGLLGWCLDWHLRIAKKPWNNSESRLEKTLEA